MSSYHPAYIHAFAAVLTLVLLLWQGVLAQAVEPTELRIDDVAAVLGSFESAELELPQGTRAVVEVISYGGESLTQGIMSVPEHDLLPARVLVGHVRVATHCGDALPIARRLVVGGSASISLSCVEIEAERGGSTRLFTDHAEFRPNEWILLWAYVPQLPTGDEGFWRDDPDPDNWVLYHLWFSDRPLEALPDLPPLPRYELDELRRPVPLGGG